MPPAARLNDRSVSGSAGAQMIRAVTASSDVLINARSAVRVGDRGLSSSCPNQEWTAKTGAPRVLINGTLAHRVGDDGFDGAADSKMMEGSSNVLIGNHVTNQEKDTYEGGFQVIDPRSGEPIRSLRYRITLASGATIDGVTDELGRTKIVRTDGVEMVQLEVIGKDLLYASIAC